MAKGAAQKTGALLTDVEELRRRARVHMERGAVTDGYETDCETVLALLNTSLATELVSALWYRRHYVVASGIHEEAVAAEFLEHATEEKEHAERIAHRIAQLGGAPNFNPMGLETRSHREYLEGADLVDMIHEDLGAEQIAIESYSEIIRYLGENDPMTRRMLEDILAVEEEHVAGLHALIQRTP